MRWTVPRPFAGHVQSLEQLTQRAEPGCRILPLVAGVVGDPGGVFGAGRVDQPGGEAQPSHHVEEIEGRREA
ncbi:hypothetical protein GCM10020358_49100 [Amorphoplanes nipponensis]|uniref:Uncharacterized protein n=1 Tax=Actinoplanes nipponensis TaxID=135950 RepID=A0A919MXD9_9ACTN|nr:hypothetical protein Ani05nite_66990 [Actinoplanes nipponensis]